ncbi:MAG: 16S rRNA (adenine(1518)-N(6)/adenine(1519)-N(6))-dimethyltransferase RsmA [Chloroflexi bacterium]|nr:16S rRNA (adenine(1518)-N(6)/adenine(1519)-N(6))-dimethyltransferase RsmA [Chloroflexota bacterium]
MLRRRDGFDEETPDQLRQWLLATLRARKIRPSKSLGQHFLLDPHVMEVSIDSARIEPTDTVIEVGPGPGFLTKRLAARAGRVVAVEIDRGMIGVLADLRRSYPNLSVVEANILSMAPEDIVGDGAYKVVANLPYYITSAAIRHFLEAKAPPTVLSLLVQREVAERICAKPGDTSLLTLSVQLYAEPRIVLRIGADSFFPAPQVESALLLLEVRPAPVVPPELISTFFRLAQAGFNDRRKQLHNALRINLHLTTSQVDVLLGRAAIDGIRRAETLALDEWRRLVEEVTTMLPQVTPEDSL